MPDPSPVMIAEDAVRAYIDTSFEREFSYDCNVNPEGLSDAVLGQRLDDAFTEMMNALAALDDTEATGVLERVQQREHDGSLFAVVTVDYVREHRAGRLQATPACTPDRPPHEKTTNALPGPGSCKL